MLVKIDNFNYTLFTTHPDFPNFFHRVTECYRNNDNNQCLFEYSGKFYIFAVNNTIEGYHNQTGFHNDGEVVAGHYGTTLMTVEDGVLYDLGNGNKEWVEFGERTFDGKYRIDLNAKEAIPVVAAHSDPVDSQSLEPNSCIGAGLWVSTTLGGVYTYDSPAAEPPDDITVGYHRFKHKALDSDGNPTSEDVFVIATSNLKGTMTSKPWQYTYQNKTYTYDDYLSDEDITATASDDKTINLTFVDYVPLNKKQTFGNGGAQVVL